MVLRALNAEVSMIGDLVTQGGVPLRQMRFAWWKDAIQSAYDGKDVKHPVITALAHTLAVQKLSQYRLQRLVAAKAADQVDHRPFHSVQDLEDFAEATQSQLAYLQLEAGSIRNSEADHAASHLGKAVGIVSLLRGMGHFLKRGINYLPVDLCAKHGVVVEQLFRGDKWDSKEVREVIYDMASTAHVHLKHSSEMHGRPDAIPREARPLFLSAVACRLFLDALQECDFYLFDSRMIRGGFSPLWYAIKLHSARFTL
jgi:NADH dehydrogenase [ubiquinone] 1 alpha subcomplex assembly factor 6